MKRILAAAALAALLIAPFARAGTVGGYPNASSPLNGTERILADQTAGSYPCVACTVNITPLQLSNYTAAQAGSFGLLFNNSGAIGGLAPVATGQYCLDWASLTAAPTLVTCTGGGSTAFQVNGTALTSSTTVNFENSVATNGVTLTFTNPSAGNVQVGLTGTLNPAGGGTGLTTTPTNGQLLIGNGTGYTLAALTAGANMSITNGAGSISLAAVPSGSSTYVQFNSSGAFGGSTYLTWNGSSNVFNVGATSTPGTVSVGALDSMIVNGTAIPVPGFALNSNIQGVIENHSYTTGTSAGAARIYLARSDGSITSPTIVVNGDHLGTIYGAGFNGVTNNYLAGGYMQFIVDGTPSSTAMPSDWILALAGATGAPAQVMRAYSNGGVVVGSPTGGNEGPGTVNMAGCYINGVACAGGSSFTVDTAPAGISVTPPCTYNMVKVTATDYQIPAPVQSAPTTSSTGGSLTGSIYYYVVTATTSAGQTTASSQQSIQSDTLSPPTIGTATATTGTGSLAAGTYYYVVTALNANGQTIASSEVSATLSATGEITVTWTAVSGATGYNVYRGTASTAENVYYAAGNVTSFTDTGATATSGSPPGVNTAYLTSTNENVISWTAVTGATGYVVYRSTTSGDFTNATSYTVSGGSTATFTDTGATGTTATPPTSNTSGQFTINAPSTCTPTDGQKLELKIISPSGGIVTYAFNSAYLASGSLALPTTSYAAGKEDYFQTQYDADKSDWVVLSYNQGF